MIYADLTTALDRSTERHSVKNWESYQSKELWSQRRQLSGKQKKFFGKWQQVEERKTARKARLQKMTENESVYDCLKNKREESLIAPTTTKEGTKQRDELT